MKQDSKKSKIQVTKTNRLPEWVRLVTLFVYELISFRILAIVVAIIFIVAIGDLFTLNGAILGFCLILFIILLYLKIQINKE